METGIFVKTQKWLSMTYPRCGSRNTERVGQSLFHCWNCDLWYGADLNTGINIGFRFLATLLTRQDAVDSPKAGDEQAIEIAACKPRSPHSFKDLSKSREELFNELAAAF